VKIGLVGPSYQERSLPFDAQRTVNLFPVLDETQQGKEVAALFGTPGKILFGAIGNGPIRAVFSAANGRAFCVSNNAFYEVFSDGTATNYGTLNTISTNCTMDENGVQVAICDGTYLYIFTYATNVFVQVTDSDFPGAGTVTYMDSYFVYNKPSSGRFYISGQYDGTTVDALDFATAESSPDNLVRVIKAVGLLWLFGDRTVEVWSNTGGTDFPFTRTEGAVMDAGCAAAHSVVLLDNSIFWLGKDSRGQGAVYRANGATPQRISTHAIEYSLQQVSDLSVLRAYTYQQDGHLFYVITGPGMATSIAFDVSTNLWHERAYLNSRGDFETDRAICSMFAFGKVLVGDKLTGNIYQLDMATYTDNGDAIRRERTFTHIENEGQRIRMNELVVDFEYGVGLTSGQGSDPVALLSISADGARTFSNEYSAGFGALGNRRARARWSRLGTRRETTFKLAVTDPVKVAICGAYLR
jgi:hypothetical protein